MTERDFEREHLRRIKGYQKEVQALFDDTIEQVFYYISLYPLPPTSVTFRLYRYPVLKAQIEERLQTFRVRLQAQIETNIRSEFAASNIKAQVLLPSNPADTFAAQEQFLRRRRYGRTLSDRVWNIHNQLQVEIEKTLSERIPQSMSVAGMARGLKQYLRNPNGASGMPSSSYKNSLRLVASETNAAYRRADIYRWQNTPNIVGYNILLGAQHRTFDICDILNPGPYPVTFEWEQWHLNCYCYAVPILSTESNPQERVTDVPDAFKAYVSDNEDKLASQKHQPYWLRDNGKFLKG